MAQLSFRVVLVVTLVPSLLILGGIILFRHHNSGLQNDFHISEVCLQCICEVDSNCEAPKCKSGESCKNFWFPESYWVEAGSPALEGPSDDRPELTYQRCVSNPFCAVRTINSYVGKNLSDDDGNGLIDCHDYARVHVKGHTDNSQEDYLSRILVRFHRCMKGFSS